MKFFVFVIRPNESVENWHIHPLTRREFGSLEHRQMTVYSCDQQSDADQLVDKLTRENPGCKIVLATPQKIGQVALFQGEIGYTTVTEKGMLPL